MTDRSDRPHSAQPGVVLITGGARGIGLGMARVCARRGWRVAVAGTTLSGAQDACAALTAEGADPAALFPLALRVEDDAAWTPALDAVEGALGPLSAMIANAGIAPRREGRKAPFASEGEEDLWRAAFAVNVDGAVQGARMVARRLMARQAPGAILMTASIVALSAVPSVSAGYSASKAALVGFVRAAAHDLGPHGIRINALNPGRIDTDMVRASGPVINDAIAAETALRRLGTADEVGEAAEFLISDRASFITGTRLNVTGGWVEA